MRLHLERSCDLIGPCLEELQRYEDGWLAVLMLKALERAVITLAGVRIRVVANDEQCDSRFNGEAEWIHTGQL